jgi:hypothetical protein
MNTICPKCLQDMEPDEFIAHLDICVYDDYLAHPETHDKDCHLNGCEVCS